MKELSIEEKAHRYDQAIKRVEDIKTGKCETTFMFTEGLFEHIFPELKESESIRLWLIDLLSTMQYHHCDEDMEMGNKAIAWLEKQGEQGEIDYDEELKRCKANPIYFFDKYVKVKLKEQKPAWKPSDEQIQALEYQVHSTFEGSWQYKASKELLEQLKKL